MVNPAPHTRFLTVPVAGNAQIELRSLGQHSLLRIAVAAVALAGGRLAAYKRPKQVFFVESLPRNVNGKLQRRALG